MASKYFPVLTVASLIPIIYCIDGPDQRDDRSIAPDVPQVATPRNPTRFEVETSGQSVSILSADRAFDSSVFIKELDGCATILLDFENDAPFSRTVAKRELRASITAAAEKRALLAAEVSSSKRGETGRTNGHRQSSCTGFDIHRPISLIVYSDPRRALRSIFVGVDLHGLILPPAVEGQTTTTRRLAINQPAVEYQSAGFGAFVVQKDHSGLTAVRMLYCAAIDPA